MRLKGGKVLIDCSDKDLVNSDVDKSFTKEEFDVIKQKGFSLYLNIENYKFYHEPFLNSISFENNRENFYTSGNARLSVKLSDNTQHVWDISLYKSQNDEYKLQIMEE